MKEKIRTFFQNEKLRGIAKKFFNKKTITGAIIILIVAAAIRIAFSLMFVVEGVVNKVEGSQITVANFITTKTVDIGALQTSSGGIQVGDRIKIMKNLSGDVISIRDESKRNINGKGNSYSNDKNSFKNNGGRNSMRRK
jgi:hypothetical protein